MFRFLVTLPAALGLLVVSLPAGEPAKGANPKIQWFGQSFFIITSSKGTRVAIDPHAIPEYGRFVGLKADVVLFSHLHNDHTQVEALDNAKDKKLKIIPGLTGRGASQKWARIDEKFKDVHIRSVGAYHDDMEGMKSGKNTIFVIDVDGWKIAHLGDLGHRLTPGQLKKLGPVDVLMIPVGGVYTLNGSDAREVVAQIKPREYILPMHYGNIRYDDLLSIDEFLDENPMAVALSKDGKLLINKDASKHIQFVKRQIITTDNTLVLDRDPQRPRPLITVLHWWPQLGKKKKAGK